MQLHSPLEIFTNIWILSGFLSWMTAQCLKLIGAFKKTGEIDFTYFVSTGGMPSAHTASMAGVMASVGMTEGFGTAVFAIMFALTGVTMFDASTVRMAAGKQAALLNVIVRAIREEHRLPEKPLKELLGHTRFEVFVGMLVGITIGALTTWCWART